MWLTQMIRTPPPPNNSPEIGPILYQVNDLLSGSWRFYRRTYARFSRMFTGPRGRSFCPLLRVPPLELHVFTDLRWTPTASTNSVTSAHLLFFFALVIKLLCFALRTSFFLRNLLKWFFRPRTSCYFFLFWMWQPILSS